MAATLQAPEIGGEPRPGVLIQWYKDDGTDVAAGEPVLCFESDFVAVDVEAGQAGRLHRCFPPGTEALPGNVIALILEPGELVPEHDEDPLAVAGVEPPPAPGSEDAKEPILLPLRRGALKAPPNAPAGGAWDRAFGSSGHDYRGFWPLRDEGPEVETSDEPVAVEEEALEPEDHGFTAEETDVPYAQFEATAQDAFAEGDAPEGDSDYRYEPAVETYEDFPEYPSSQPEPGPASVVLAWPQPAPAPAFYEAEPEPVADVAPATWPEAIPAYAAAPVALRGMVRLTELRKLSEQLGREWRDSAPAPRNEDLIVRAAARAVLESSVLSELGDSVGLVTPARDGDLVSVLENAARGSLRERVSTLTNAVPSLQGECSFTVTSFAIYGIDEAIPVIPEGHVLSFAMGATRPGSTMEDGIPAPVMTLTLAFAPDRITQGEAATLFARVRELVEAPYALLAD